jgi:HJR/Mrr/RecB family endonuclease
MDHGDILALFCLVSIIGIIVAVTLFAAYQVNRVRKWWGNRKTGKQASSINDPAYHFSMIDRLDIMRKMNPVEFESFIGSLFSGMGYLVDTTKKSGDHGVDLYLRKDGNLAIVQCKRYNEGNQISEGTVRDFYGSMLHERASEGYIVTTSSFTMPARHWARGKFLHLVDGRELSEWAKIAHEKPPINQTIGAKAL